MTSQSGWRPDWTVPPGEILAEELETRGISQSELARRMDRPVKTINEIVNAKAAVTPETALQLELALGISASLWTGLETNYRQQLAREKVLSQFEDHIDWASSFPLKELRQRRVIDPDATGGELVASLLRFFGVSSVNAWKQRWETPRAAFRRSTAFESSLHATAAWLRWGENAAAEVPTEPFDRGRLLGVLTEARSMTREEPFADVVEDLREDLASCGVVLILTPDLGGTRASGAARWLSSERALIQLTLRYKSDDQFWFSVFHEAGHLIGDRNVEFVDADTDPDGEADEAERRADRWARDVLIPPDDYERFVAAGRFDASAVREFAKEQGVAPGIVVGRLQRDRHVPYGSLNTLKRKLDWV
ncbi:MAG TPA: HigA family addiction module antitoxin [Thermoleophilaceae bacterium]|nr:HigA family addiction module antitoxin [Thermoleophilaceae bacterium]